VQTELAKTLRSVSKERREVHVHRRLGAAICKLCTAEGGKATLEDMKRYQPVWKNAQHKFSGNTVFAPGVSGGGGYQLL